MTPFRSDPFSVSCIVTWFCVFSACDDVDDVSFESVLLVTVYVVPVSVGIPAAIVLAAASFPFAVGGKVRARHVIAGYLSLWGFLLGGTIAFLLGVMLLIEMLDL